MKPLALYVLSLILWQFPPGRQPDVESREWGAARLEVVARALADSAIDHGDAWEEGERDFARVMVATAGLSMGFTLAVQVGDRRGPGGAVCLADLQPSTLRRFAAFETAGRTDDELAWMVTGRDYDSLRRCFDTGFAVLASARKYADRHCQSYPTELATFAVFVSGVGCASKGTIKIRGEEKPRSELELMRVRTLEELRQRKATRFPRWYTPPPKAP